MARVAGVTPSTDKSAICDSTAELTDAVYQYVIVCLAYRPVPGVIWSAVTVAKEERLYKVTTSLRHCLRWMV